MSQDCPKNWLKGQMRVPPTGVEPAHPPPEGGALSTELRGPILLPFVIAG